MLVLDASVVLAWHFEDEASAAIDDFRIHCASVRFYVPRHWLAEIANGLLVGERRKRTIPSRTALFVGWLDTLAIAADDEGARRATTDLLPLARQYGLTIYDAAYLELAMRRSLPLATLDMALAAAAQGAGVAVIDLADDAAATSG